MVPLLWCEGAYLGVSGPVGGGREVLGASLGPKSSHFLLSEKVVLGPRVVSRQQASAMVSRSLGEGPCHG